MLLWILPALLLSIVQAHDSQQRAPEVFHVRAGDLVVLPCRPALSLGLNVSWSRAGQSLGRAAEDDDDADDDDVKVQDRHLWFTPVRPSHGGAYTCHYRSQSRESQATMELIVSREKCPSVAEPSKVLHLEENGNILCKLPQVLNLSSENVRWTKGCAPLLRPGAELGSRGELRLTKVSLNDTGNYTCFVTVTVRGRSYSASWSVEVEVTDDSVFMEPHVVYPRDEEVKVHVGGRVELRCEAELGHKEDSNTLMYWLLNDTETEAFPEVNDSWTTVSDGHRVQAVSTLTISEVHSGLMNISITCWVQNTVGADYGQFWLTPAEPSPLLRALTFSLSLSLALMLLTALIYGCRVELVLLYRKLRSRFTTQYEDDGRCFDGVVTCLTMSPVGHTPPELSVFSLQLLPQRVERQWGYRLYVPERDARPGEAIHDAVSETVKRSRRLLLLLCGPQGALSASEELQPLCYEQRVGLYDALMLKELRVILIEIGGPVDYSRLPESLQYLRRKQGALQWRPRPRTGLGLFLSSERSFWNRLRYHMPPTPSGRGGAKSNSASHCRHKDHHIQLDQSRPSPKEVQVQVLS